MKLLIVLALLIGVATAAATNGYEEDPIKYECNTSEFCNSHGEGKLYCNSTLHGFRLTESGLNTHLNEQLTASFDYLLLASYYNTYSKNRPGFNKLFQGLSDNSWDNAISIIKHITQRGGKVKKVEILRNNKDATKALKTDIDEVEAMGLALNLEKRLTHSVQKIHRQSSHERHGHDPNTAHYLEEHFLEPQVETIRKLAGYTTDLAKFSISSDSSLAFFIFDEYLQKQ